MRACVRACELKPCGGVPLGGAIAWSQPAQPASRSSPSEPARGDASRDRVEPQKRLPQHAHPLQKAPRGKILVARARGSREKQRARVRGKEGRGRRRKRRACWVGERMHGGLEREVK